MALRIVTPPPVEPLSLSETKTFLRVEANDAETNTEIGAMIATARANLDGSAGWLNRALVMQTWDYTLAEFPARIDIPLPPLREVVSLSYVDGDGATQALVAGTDYVVIDRGDVSPSRIEPAYGKAWPQTRVQSEAVTLRFSAGYAPSGSPEDYVENVPAPIKHAMKLMIRDLYDQRSDFVAGRGITPVGAVRRLLAPYRVWSFQ